MYYGLDVQYMAYYDDYSTSEYLTRYDCIIFHTFPIRLRFPGYCCVMYMAIILCNIFIVRVPPNLQKQYCFFSIHVNITMQRVIRTA